jgi:hypothetical protein
MILFLILLGKDIDLRGFRISPLVGGLGSRIGGPWRGARRFGDKIGCKGQRGGY